MANQIIPANWHKYRSVFQKDGEKYLNVSEFYCDTIQGEGVYIGHPAAFLRLQRCSLNCVYCDTTEVWRYGSPYTFNELFKFMHEQNLPYKLSMGQHLVITGGSPLLQQERLHAFMMAFLERYKFLPFVEIENEAVIPPEPSYTHWISCWNNSPKLASSGVPFGSRYKPEVIQQLAKIDNSWFKFVISNEADWNEIERNFISLRLVRKDQIILMPEGATRKRLEETRQLTVEMAIKHNVKYTSREHIVLWNKKVGT